MGTGWGTEEGGGNTTAGILLWHLCPCAITIPGTRFSSKSDCESVFVQPHKGLIASVSKELFTFFPNIL